MNRIFDVTVPLSTRIPTFPGDPRFELTPTHRMSSGAPYNTSQVVMGTHTGTHVDAPFHFWPEGATVDQLPLEVLLGPARVVESAADSLALEEVAGLDLRGVTRVLFKTRMSGRLRQPGFEADFVYMTPEAATHLVERGMRLVGIDSLSIEQFGREDFTVHRQLLRAGIVLVEGLDLSGVPPGDYDLTCLPMLVAGGDGAPARVILRADS